MENKEKESREEFPINKGVGALLCGAIVWLLYGKIGAIVDLFFLLVGLACTYFVVKNSMGLTLWVFNSLDKETSWKEYLARGVAERAVNQKVGKSSTSHPGENFDAKNMTIEELQAILEKLTQEEKDKKAS